MQSTIIIILTVIICSFVFHRYPEFADFIVKEVKNLIKFIGSKIKFSRSNQNKDTIDL